MANPIDSLREQGQSLWLDYIQRHLILSGQLAAMVEKRWVSGVTSNPSIFNKAIAGSDDYTHDLATIGESGVRDSYEAFVAVGGQDIRLAAEVLATVFERTGGRDGFVSLEVPPKLADDRDETVAEAKRLFKLIGKPNVMIKVPGTHAGTEALEELIFEGVNVNQTLLFDVALYEKSAAAYISGLQRRADAELPVDNIASVASFFVSRVDTAVDTIAPAELQGKAAIANASRAYARFKSIFAGDTWEGLAAKGARVQRPLWASTSTKNPAYPDTKYIDGLVAPETVNTVPEPTLEAFAEHGRAESIDANLAEADSVFENLASAGIDMSEVTARLLQEGLDAFAADFDKLLSAIDDALRTPRTEDGD